MHSNKSGCGHWGHGKGDMSEWKEKYEKMDPKEKKEMLEEKIKHLEKKMDWAKSELGKLEE
jgi:hypothetical protein